MVGNGIDYYSTVTYWWGNLLAYNEKESIDCDVVIDFGDTVVEYFVVIDEDTVVDDVGVGHCVADCIENCLIV